MYAPRVDQGTPTVARPEDSAPASGATRSGIGERLRRVRLSLGLSLVEVQARTGGEFKTSALGAYERGERALSIERLGRLAEVYHVDAARLLATEATIDLTAMHAEDEAGLASSVDSFTLAALARFSAYVRTMRREPTLTPLMVRAGDLDYLTVLLGRTPHEVNELLGGLGLRARTG